MASPSVYILLMLWASGELVPAEKLCLKGHETRVLSVAISPDGKQIASCDEEGVIIMWDAETGKRLADFKAHFDAVRSIVFRPDGKILYSAGDNGIIKSWDIQNYKMLDYIDHGSRILSLSASPRGKTLATIGRDGSVKFWSTESMKRKDSLDNPPSNVESLTFSRGDKYIIIAIREKGVAVYDTMDKKMVASFEYNLPPMLGALPLYATAIHHEGRLAAFGGTNSVVEIWDLKAKKDLEIIKGHTLSVTSLLFIADSNRLVSGSIDGRIGIWDAMTRERLIMKSAHKGGVLALALTSDGTVLVSGGNDSLVRVWTLPKSLQK